MNKQLRNELLNFFKENKNLLKEDYSPEYLTDLVTDIKINAQKKGTNHRQTLNEMADAIKDLERAKQKLEKLHKKFNGNRQSKALQKEIQRLIIGYAGTADITYTQIQLNNEYKAETISFKLEKDNRTKFNYKENALLFGELEKFWFSHTVQLDKPTQNAYTPYAELLSIITELEPESAVRQRSRVILRTETP